ncbi:lipoprotein [Streptomyces amakusaensis]|uniref:Lipoprotein n=1 Tax=Streptomyces amakusaensis TaxID=67271 RepID=A0ABW0ALQ5_9ACTN
MSKTAWKRAGVSATAIAMVVGAAGCGTESGAQERTVTQALTASYKKTEKARTAEVTHEITMKGGPKGENGTAKISGVQGWDPTLMDLTMTGGGELFASGAPAPEKMAMKWVGKALYMDMGAEAAKDMDGKRWMKMDLGAIAEMSGESGDKELQKQLTGGLDSMNQDPAQQMAFLLESPNVKRVGEKKIDGVRAQHYRGSLTVEEMLKGNKTVDLLDDKERESLLDGMKASGIKTYDTELWINEDDLPVRIEVSMKTSDGDMDMVSTYSGYGVEVKVEAPPAGQTVDVMEMFTDLGKAMEESAPEEEPAKGTDETPIGDELEKALKDLEELGVDVEGDASLQKDLKELEQAEKDLKKAEAELKELQGSTRHRLTPPGH